MVDHTSSITCHFLSRFYTGTNLHCLVTEAQGCEQLAQGCCASSAQVGVEPMTSQSPVQCSTHTHSANVLLLYRVSMFVWNIRHKKFPLILFCYLGLLAKCAWPRLGIFGKSLLEFFWGLRESNSSLPCGLYICIFLLLSRFQGSCSKVVKSNSCRHVLHLSQWTRATLDERSFPITSRRCFDRYLWWCQTIVSYILCDQPILLILTGWAMSVNARTFPALTSRTKKCQSFLNYGSLYYQYHVLLFQWTISVAAVCRHNFTSWHVFLVMFLCLYFLSLHCIVGL